MLNLGLVAIGVALLIVIIVLCYRAAEEAYNES